MLCVSDEMAEVLEKIRLADEMQLDEILNAVQQRRQELFPNWELATLSLPKDDAQKRQEILEFAWKILKM